MVSKTEFIWGFRIGAGHRAAIRLLFCLLLLSVSPVMAGIVEDAEEELKKLRQQTDHGGSPRRVLSGEQAVGSYPESSPPRNHRVHGNKRAGNSKTGAPGKAGAEVVAKDAAKKKSSDKKRKKVKKRQKSDRLLSIFGILLLISLVVGGTVFSRSRNTTN